MTSVKVAVRVRPKNKRENASSTIIAMEDNQTRITNPKVPELSEIGDHGRDKLKLREFCFDHSFWSVDPTDPHFVTQQQVFEAIGPDVLTAVYEGYNVCVFAYGQTGSGKTFTMMGSEDNPGFIPRFCEGMFSKMNDPNSTYRTQVSYLEIYNEKVRDLLKCGTTNGKASHKLRIREHPKDGPYVQDLSQHTVISYDGIADLMKTGSNNRVTASTAMNDVSSRSHAIFTITFTQAKFQNGLPSERQSKINLVDLAGSERADSSGATGQRLKEGGSINKSLVTLGNVISVLAEAAEGKVSRRHSLFIPYRDSQLTWLLKDSLGGNAKTIMIATISPSELNYGETLSTLRYASRAKSIINRPTVNEDANVRLIRELREEIARLKALLAANTDFDSAPKFHEMLHENEARIKVLTEEWTDKWKESASILEEEKELQLRKEGAGVILDSSLPHLVGMNDDVLSTGIMLYHLREGLTKIGTEESDETQDIVISGENVEADHCLIEHRDGVVTLHPLEPAVCMVNWATVTDPIQLNQGALIQLGQSNKFRFNYPAEAKKLKQIRKSMSTLSLSKSPVMAESRTSLLSHSLTELYRSNDSLTSPSAKESGGKERRPLMCDMAVNTIWECEESVSENKELLNAKRKEVQEMEERYREEERTWLSKRQHMEEQLNAKEQEIVALQNQMASINQMMSPSRSMEEALRRLEQQEETHLQETRKMKEELILELRDLSANQMASECSISIAMTELDQQTAVRHAQIAVLQEENETRRQALQKDLLKEQTQAEVLEKELAALHREMSAERERVLSKNSKLQAAYDQINQLEEALHASHARMDEEKKAGWQTSLERLEKEMSSIQESLLALKCQEEEVNSKLNEDGFDMDKERLDYQNKREHNKQMRMALQEQEAQVSVAQSAEMESIKAEMEAWNMQKAKELFAMEKKHADFLKRKSKKISCMWKRMEAKQSEVEMQQEKCEHAVKLLQTLDGQVQQQIKELREEQDMLLHLKKIKTQEVVYGTEEKREREAEVNCKLTQLEQSTEEKLQEIHTKKEHLLDLQKKWEEHPDSQEDPANCMDDALKEVFEERQKELEEKTQECQELTEKVNVLQHELNCQRHQQEEEREAELDSICVKKLQLQELERQERINLLVEQEVKRRLFDEKVERERVRRTEKERERGERELEIQRLKCSHEQELHSLQTKLGYSNRNLLSSWGLSRASLATLENRRKLVKQMSSVGSPPPLEISIPDFALRGSGRETYFEFQIKIQIGVETLHLFRRYTHFRELHQSMRKRFPNVEFLVFPGRKLFHKTQRVAAERRIILEQYLKDLFQLCQRDKTCVLHPDNNQFLTKHVLGDFDSFFRRGLFEHPRHIAS